ncbi:Transmembrane protein [Parasponia andersonii]|uniref:Transmembrane protein n=1 Tax=Parasponia andersonii TaxID=3476 RepID=A0A2P5DH65_PARAD|nr:Transmembrane protein [Parasponia andersonii]
MGAITTAVIAIAGVVLGWIAIEIACKPCLEKGREAIDRSLNPDYDPDDNDLRTPLNPNPDSDNVAADPNAAVSTSTTTTTTTTTPPDAIKAV